MIKKTFVAFLTMATCVVSINAQTTDPFQEHKQLFVEAKTLFNNKNYSVAQSKINLFLKGKVSEQDMHYAKYIDAACAFRLKQHNRVAKLQDVLYRVQESPYRNRLVYMIGVAMNEDQQNDEYTNEILAMLNSCKLELLPKEDMQEAKYVLGVNNLKINNTDEAAFYFQQLENTKYHTDCLYYLGYINYKQSEYKEALKFFSQYRQRATGNNIGIDNKYVADTYLKMKMYDKAEEFIKATLQKRNTSGIEDLKMLLGEATYMQEKYAESATAFNEVEDNIKSYKSAPYTYMAGISNYNIGKYNKAIDYLSHNTNRNDLIAQNSNLYIGLSYLKLFDKKKARMAFQQASLQDYSDKIKEQAAYNYALASYETSSSAFGESVRIFEDFLNKYQSSVYSDKISMYLIDTYNSTTNYEYALNSINRINRPSNTILKAKQKILLNIGKEKIINSNINEAISRLEEAISLGSLDTDVLSKAYYWCGEAYYRIDNSKQAKPYFEKAVATLSRKSEEYPLANYALGYINFNNKDYVKAQSLFNNFLATTNNSNKDLTSDAYVRLGDCYMSSRMFNEAKQNFSKAEQISGSLGDYALYQTAIIQGLQKDYSKKINTLNQMIKKYPQSNYLVNAIYEKGRSYVVMNKSKEAIEEFDAIKRNYPNTHIARLAATEIGLIYFRNDDYNKAIDAYKYVVDTYPLSQEARTAMADLKTIYMETNRINEFVDYNKSKSNILKLNVSDEDSLTFASGYNLYLRNNNAEATKALNNYIDRYADGAYRIDAYYLLFKMNKESRDNEKLLQYANEVLQYPNNKYTEEVLREKAKVSYLLQRYEQAYDSYKQLSEMTMNEEVSREAYVGLIRSAYLLDNNSEVATKSAIVLKDKKLSPEIANEILYYRANANKKLSDRESYINDLKQLKADTRNKYGAEARYLYAKELFADKRYADAEKELLSYIDESTPHSYWLARSFVLLADVYYATNKKFEAEQYLKSLQQNYKANDDIQKMITDRLSKGK